MNAQMVKITSMLMNWHVILYVMDFINVWIVHSNNLFLDYMINCVFMPIRLIVMDEKCNSLIAQRTYVVHYMGWFSSYIDIILGMLTLFN